MSVEPPATATHATDPAAAKALVPLARAPGSARQPLDLRVAMGNRAFGAILARDATIAAAPPATRAPATPADLTAERWNVVIVGSPGENEVKAGHSYQFAEAARILGGTGPHTVWLVEQTGYDHGGVDRSGVTSRAGSATLFWITPERPLESLLKQFPAGSIESLSAYSHGLVGLLALRHGWGDLPDYGLDTAQARRLTPAPFTADAKLSLDSCNAGTGGDGALAQVISQAVQHPVEAWTGRTSYYEFNHPTEHPTVRGSEIFTTGGGIDTSELGSQLIGRHPDRFLFAPLSSPGDFTSTYRIAERLPKSRMFPVTQGASVTIEIDAYSDYTPCQGAPVTVQLHRVRTFFDDDVGSSHVVKVGGAAQRFTWSNLDEGTYYLEIWQLSGFDVEGDVSVRIGAAVPARPLARATHSEGLRTAEPPPAATEQAAAPTSPATMTAAHIRSLQQSAGNRAVTSLLRAETAAPRGH